MGYGSGSGRSSSLNSTLIVLAIVFLFLVAVALLVLPNIFGYMFQVVNSGEVGVLTRYGEFIEVLPPGMYTNPFDWGADITNVNVSAITFEITDPEVALAGEEMESIKQSIGVMATGTVFRPGVAGRGNVSGLTAALWSDYRAIYTNDESLKETLAYATKQALKVCVGPRTLASAAVGSQRNDLANCVGIELSSNLMPYALSVANIAVPDVILPDEIKASILRQSELEQGISEANLQVELVHAQGLQDAAAVRASVQVTAASQQSQLEARSTLASAERQAIEDEQAVVIAQATLDGLVLENQRAQAAISLEIATIKAQSETAQVTRLAQLYQENPEYVNYLISVAYAEGLRTIEKVFYIPADTRTIQMLNGGLVNQDGAPIPVIPLDVQSQVVPTPGS